jgi:hypothetical protein
MLPGDSVFSTRGKGRDWRKIPNIKAKLPVIKEKFCGKTQIYIA